MAEKNDVKTKLSDLLEKIVVVKSCSPEDQNEINTLARSGQCSVDEMRKINQIAEMIGKGQIRVN